MALTDRGATERRRKNILYVTKTAAAPLFSDFQAMKQWRHIPISTPDPEWISGNPKVVSDPNKSLTKNASGIHWTKDQRWWQLLQDDNYRLGVAKKKSDVSETIQKTCENAAKVSVALLAAEHTSVTYQLKDGQELSYFTFYEQDRIYCKKFGKEDYEWEIPLENEQQYDKVMAFLDSLKEKENQSCTIHNTFWQDYLSGKLDIEDFLEFLNTETPDNPSKSFYLSEDGSVPDKTSMKYSIYTYGASFGAYVIRSTEELMQWQKKQMAKALEEWDKTHLSWLEQWNRDHPDLVGVKCFLVNGKWYTAQEFMNLE